MKRKAKIFKTKNFLFSASLNIECFSHEHVSFFKIHPFVIKIEQFQTMRYPVHHKPAKRRYGVCFLNRKNRFYPKKFYENAPVLRHRNMFLSLCKLIGEKRKWHNSAKNRYFSIILYWFFSVQYIENCSKSKNYKLPSILILIIFKKFTKYVISFSYRCKIFSTCVKILLI